MTGARRACLRVIFWKGRAGGCQDRPAVLMELPGPSVNRGFWYSLTSLPPPSGTPLLCLQLTSSVFDWSLRDSGVGRCLKKKGGERRMARSLGYRKLVGDSEGIGHHRDPAFTSYTSCTQGLKMAIKQCSPLIPIHLECGSVRSAGIYPKSGYGSSLWLLQNISNGVFLCVCLDAFLISHGLVFERLPFSDSNKRCLAILWSTAQWLRIKITICACVALCFFSAIRAEDNNNKGSMLS